MNRWANLRRFGFTLLLASLVFSAAIYTDFIKNLPIVWQGFLLVFLALIQLRLDYFFQYLQELNRNRVINQKFKQLEDESNQNAQELNELRELIVTFLEKSEIYREKVKDHLRLGEDYLCIAKSSEGLSQVWGAIGGGVQLPFTQTLADLPGSIKPFERFNLFLIPLRNLPPIRGRTLTLFVDEEIIPLVEEKREKFLAKIPPRIARLANQFSYKYLAFTVSRENVGYSVLNRKFNREFSTFVINEQISSNFKELKSELADVVRTKEVFQLIEWASFANLNAEQSELIDYYREQINIALQANGITRLVDLTTIDAVHLQEILWPIVYRKSTTIKVRNICKKVVEGAINTIETLRRNGVRF